MTGESGAHWSWGSVPAAAAPHSPSAPAVFRLAAQAWQRPVHAESQQTPSTQWPDAQCARVVHASPLLESGTHAKDAASQKKPAWHDASDVQDDGHAACAPSHR